MNLVGIVAEADTADVADAVLATWTTNRCRWVPVQPNAICNTACDRRSSCRRGAAAAARSAD